MKHILTMIVLLTSLVTYSQDTLCVMVTSREVIHFNWYTSDVIDRYDHTDTVKLHVAENETMCINLYDGKDGYRDVLTEFDDGDHTHYTFKSKDNLIKSKNEWPAFTMEISPYRRKE